MADACLYDHNPSPQRCAQMGGVWDETRAVSTHLGGTCLTHVDAHAYWQIGGKAMEVVEVELSHDGNLAAFMEDKKNASTIIRWSSIALHNQLPRQIKFCKYIAYVLEMLGYRMCLQGMLWACMPMMLILGLETSLAPDHCRCIRWADAAVQHQASMKFYGPMCVEDADRAELETYMSSGVSPEQQQRVLEQVQLQSIQQSLGPWHKADPLERRPPKPPPRCSHTSMLEDGNTDPEL